jgi:hypothetical protein
MPFVFALVAGASVLFVNRFGDTIHFWVMSPYYFDRVIDQPWDRHRPRRAAFPWRDGAVLYDEVAGEVDPKAVTAPSPLAARGCWREMKRMFGHFYVLHDRCEE